MIFNSKQENVKNESCTHYEKYTCLRHYEVCLSSTSFSLSLARDETLIHPGWSSTHISLTDCHSY